MNETYDQGYNSGWKDGYVAGYEEALLSRWREVGDDEETESDPPETLRS